MGKQAITVSDKIPGSVVVTDITSLKDEQSPTSQNGSIPKESAGQEKKAEQVISEMSKNQAELSTEKHENIIKAVVSKVYRSAYSYYKKVMELIYD